MSDSFLQPPGLWPTSLLCPWDFPGKNTGLPFPSLGDLPDSDWTHVSCIGRQILYHWTTREAQVFYFKKTWQNPVRLTHHLPNFKTKDCKAKSPWFWERLRAEREHGVRGWDGWIASLMQWTWTWANFRRWWGTGRPSMLQSTGLQKIRHDWVTEKQPQRSSGKYWFKE